MTDQVVGTNAQMLKQRDDLECMCFGVRVATWDSARAQDPVIVRQFADRRIPEFRAGEFAVDQHHSFGGFWLAFKCVFERESVDFKAGHGSV